MTPTRVDRSAKAASIPSAASSLSPRGEQDSRAPAPQQTQTAGVPNHMRTPHSRIHAIVFTTLVCALMPLTADSGSVRASTAKACPPSGTVRVDSNSKGVAYRTARSRRLVACLRATGHRTYLDLPPDVVVYPPPAIDLAGHYVAYALEGTDDPEGEADTVIQMRDLRTSHTPVQFAPDRGAAFATGSPNLYDAKVGSLRAQPSGSVAWIACRTSDNIREEWGDPRPSCVKPGAVDEVRVLRAGENKAETLAVGRGIHPRSLRLKDGRISWKRYRRTHSAPLR